MYYQQHINYNGNKCEWGAEEFTKHFSVIIIIYFIVRGILTSEDSPPQAYTHINILPPIFFLCWLLICCYNKWQRQLTEGRMHLFLQLYVGNAESTTAQRKNPANCKASNWSKKLRDHFSTLWWNGENKQEVLCNIKLSKPSFSSNFFFLEDQNSKPPQRTSPNKDQIFKYLSDIEREGGNFHLKHQSYLLVRVASMCLKSYVNWYCSYLCWAIYFILSALFTILNIMINYFNPKRILLG